MKHNRTWARLLEKENDWLEKDLFEEQNIKTEAGPGRPKVQFKDASDRTKRKRVAELVDQHETDALAAAAAVRGKQSPGKSDVAFVIKRTKKDAEGVRRSIEESKKKPVKMTPEDALALKTACNLSDDQYQMIRNSSKDHNADIYPSLHTILEEKNKCYPSQIEFTETSAKCNLQQMCEHTLSRVIKMVDFSRNTD